MEAGNRAGFSNGSVKRGRSLYPVAVVCALLVFVTVVGMASVFLLYRDSLVESEKGSLELMAQSASKNLSDLFDLELATLDTAFSQRAADAQLVYAGSVEAAIGGLLEQMEERPEGALKTEYAFVSPEDADLLPTEVLPSGEGAEVSYWYRGDDSFLMVLLKPVYMGGELIGYVSETLDLNEVYALTLAPYQVGERGYFTVKDPSRVIVMHRVPDQIGSNTQVDRVEGKPEGDWNALSQNQYSGEAGCEIVKSYWWDDLDAGVVRKFIGYAPVYLGKNMFVVNVVMSYDELMQPLSNMFTYCVLLGGVVLLFASLGGWSFVRSRQDARHLERELEYEQELHAQTQRLRLQEQQIQQIDRLQTMGVVSSSLAHELKNLMTPLSIYGQMLEDDTLSGEERREVASEMGAVTRKASDLLQRMLSYVRKRPGDVRMTKEFDATEAVREAMAMVRPMCPRDVSIQEDVCEEGLVLRGERAGISQIVLNLVTNSLYAMKDGGGTLTIGWDRDPERGACALLRVADTGCGMDEETQKKLFTSFFTTKGEDGTGLGMSVVQTLVHSMGGSIEVKSTFGEGTEFLVRFPLNVS